MLQRRGDANALVTVTAVLFLLFSLGLSVTVFEATSVLMPRMVGIDVAVALSATLLFRGLRFWLPMFPDTGVPARPGRAWAT
jgi:hypothetical protein